MIPHRRDSAEMQGVDEMINRKDEVVSTWVGQDGNQWRELKVWVGNGYRSFTQRHLANGIWI